MGGGVRRGWSAKLRWGGGSLTVFERQYESWVLEFGLGLEYKWGADSQCCDVKPEAVQTDERSWEICVNVLFSRAARIVGMRDE